MFYLGIAEYELKNFEQAITQFNKALRIFPEFSDAEYYKAVCLKRLGQQKEFEIVYDKAAEDYKNGFKLNEDNTIYETYPYQIKFKS